MNHNKLWKILKEMGIPDHLTCLLRNLHAGQEATIRTGYRTTDWFQIGKGECQGCISSSCLLKLYAEYIMWNKQGNNTQPWFGTSLCCSMSSSNCHFLTYIQISQEPGQVVWYSHLFKNVPKFVVIHTVKSFGVVNKAKVDFFWNSLAFSMIQFMLAIWYSILPKNNKFVEK